MSLPVKATKEWSKASYSGSPHPGELGCKTNVGEKRIGRSKFFF